VVAQHDKKNHSTAWRNFTPSSTTLHEGASENHRKAHWWDELNGGECRERVTRCKRYNDEFTWHQTKLFWEPSINKLIKIIA
jgi:hypothetical protein